MQLAELQAILSPQKTTGKPGRTRVIEQSVVTIELAHQRNVPGQRIREVLQIPEQPDASVEFSGLSGFVRIEAVGPGSGMGIYVAHARGLASQMIENPHQHEMLEHIRVIAGMESMSITEHVDQSDLKSRIGRQSRQITRVAAIEIAPPRIMVLPAPMAPAQAPTQMVPTLLAVWAARIIRANARPLM